MTIKIKKTGLMFSYHNDEILYRWPWKRLRPYDPEIFHSALFSRDFNNFREYWAIVGQQEAILNKVSTKVHGFNLGEVLAKWAGILYPDQFIVTLNGMDTSAKPPTFWGRLSREKIQAMTSDVVALCCRDSVEAEALISSIDTVFAEAYLVYNGRVLDSNMWSHYDRPGISDRGGYE